MPTAFVRVLSVAILWVALAGCDATAPEPSPPSSERPTSAAAAAYLDEVLDILEANALYRERIRWDLVRAEAEAEIEGAQTIGATYPGIRVALRALDDNYHSFLRPPPPLTGTIRGGSTVCTSGPLVPPDLPDDVGYVFVSGFSGGGDEATAFATGIQRRIQTADREGLVGWIVDLRLNTGGNMWPMLAGLGPVLGEGVVGHFVAPGGVVLPWAYQDGASILNGHTVVKVASPVRLRRERPRVAVLLDTPTASSGEATAIAFERRPDTRSFGSRTCGLSTANAGLPLSDGATLYLAVSFMADRERSSYREGVEPDEATSSSEETIRRAIGWLRDGV
ncbi:S41 family peptidase [Rubrivirga sp. IMCC45206]|uniref:S41 family peptidase n=1 Tax=Rubrivirga sp. IMCC45206 TaxID=3391614 RepID=UPI0039900A0E